MVIGEIARLNAIRWGNKPALKDKRKQVSFKETNQRMNCFIRYLCSLGLKKGDRVAVLLYNCVEFCELQYAIPKAGLILVPMNYRFTGKELKYILNNSQASMLVYEDDFIDTIEDIKQDLETVNHYVVVNHSAALNTTDSEYETVIAGQSSQEPQIQVDEKDIAYIIYTSGTTGFPKGVMLSHKSILTNLYNSLFEKHPRHDDVLLDVPPLYHCAAQSELFVSFFFGCLTILIKQFDPEEVMETIQREQPSVLHLVPAMQHMIVNHPRIGDYHFKSIRSMLYGGSSILRSHLINAMEVFKCDFFQTAGQTEGGPGLTFLRPEDHIIDGPPHLLKRLESAGQEAKLTEVRIVDLDGNECPPNVPGEEIARGDNVMDGYWNMPEETAKTLKNGWLHTGDICVKDEDGYITYVDRMKDMICRGGENIYPKEIENVIISNPRISEVAVIGVPDERLQEEIMAVVVMKKDQILEKNEIVQIVEKELARFKKPRYVEFVDQLPKNPSGKILKRVLKQQFGNETMERVQ